MQITYQGKPTETAAGTLAAFLAEQNFASETIVLELNGQILGKEHDLGATALREGDVLNVFRIVGGG